MGMKMAMEMAMKRFYEFFLDGAELVGLVWLG